ncbi:MAG TPA: hypothetical protein VM618_04550, partial [Acidimicrobiia bacterium]|nr:hypothetical protein [Acidimicrobiia bacterium]
MRTRSGIGVKTATASHGERETGGRLPDFVIVGSMKSGTTSLFQYLGLHPGVGLPARKELDFFVAHRNWRRGEGWYRSQFAPVADGLVTGESSPNYTMRHLFPGVAERMAAVVPDARLLYVVRDP